MILFSGTLQITATNTKQGNNIILLHVTDSIRIEDPYVTIADTNEQIRIISTFPYKRNEYLVMKLSEGMQVNAKILINIQFERYFDSDEQQGFFMRKYKDAEGTIK